MPIKPILEEDILIKGSIDGVMILLNTEHDFEKLIKKLIQKIKKDKKFLSESKLIVKGMDRNLDPDELGMIRKMVKDKTGLVLNSPEIITPIPEKKIDIIPHSLRAGETISTLNDVAIFGDINPGAIVTAAGSVYVYGKIRGSVHAGSNGDLTSMITCLGLSPIQIQIAKVPYSPEEDSSLNHSSICYLKLEGQEVKLTPFKKD